METPESGTAAGLVAVAAGNCVTLGGESTASMALGRGEATVFPSLVRKTTPAPASAASAASVSPTAARMTRLRDGLIAVSTVRDAVIVDAGKAALEGGAMRPSSRGADTKRIKELERELRRKDKALAETAALLVLQKKVREIWGDGDDDTNEGNGK